MRSGRQHCHRTIISLPLRDYLRDEGKFYTPPTNDTQQYSSGLNRVEIGHLDEHWKPMEARRDIHMVDALIVVLDNFLRDRQLLDLVKMNIDLFNAANPISQNQNANEVQARNLVRSGAVGIATLVMHDLGQPITVYEDHPPHDFSSKVDFALSSNGVDKALVDVKAPGILNKVLELILNRWSGFSLEWNRNFTVPEKVIYKACLCMASHKARWLALTSHDKWVFFRLHDHATWSYVTFSSVEEQADNTRPLRAFLGMVLAVEMGFEVDSNANMDAQLERIPEEEGESHSSEHTYDDQSEGQASADCRTTRSKAPTQQRVLISWSQEAAANSQWLSFCVIEGSDQCSFLGNNVIRLRLQRLIGQGSTGVAYEAKMDVDGHGLDTDSSLAIKIVMKGKWEEEDGRIERLNNEFRIYRVIEQARRNGTLGNVSPRCYGLFEDPFTLALITDYAGESLSDAEWASLHFRDRSQIFGAIHELHAIGILHGDLDPRNIVRDADNTFKIIDFSSSELHECRGIRALRDRGVDRKEGGECGELRRMWRELMHANKKV